MPAPKDPSTPAVSRRSQPRFGTRERRAVLAGAFARVGPEYDRLRPGYPREAIEAILETVAPLDEGPEGPRGPAHGRSGSADGPDVVDLGAGTGKLSWALARRGARVTAVDPSASMLDAAGGGPLPDPTDQSSTVPGTVITHQATAEETGLPGASADLVTAAQAWHWFDADAASAEARRLLRAGGVLALLWNTLDVRIPWVHRYSRIMHAGDVQRDDFAPAVAGGFEPVRRLVTRWEDPMPTTDLVDLARTRSYVITADAPTRDRVLGNLDWYVHEHLGHARGDVVGLPYRSDLFLFRRAS